MVEQLEPEKRLRVYELIIKRYGKYIGEQEEHSVTDTRQKVSPYTEFVVKLRSELIKDYSSYKYETDFFSAVHTVLAYFQEIKTCSFPFTFWMTFEEMDELKIANWMSKAIFIVALLRSLDARDARIIVTKSGKYYVWFGWKEQQYLIKPDSGSLLADEDVKKMLEEDKAAYAFNDLAYESYEEE